MVFPTQDALAEEAQLDSSDPYARDPPPHPALLLRARKPCTAETPRSLLTHSWITPADLWYIRSHHPVPTVDPATYRLEVSGPGLKTLSLSLSDLKWSVVTFEGEGEIDPRWYGSAGPAEAGKKLVIFGGYNGKAYINSTLELEFERVEVVAAKGKGK